MDRLKHFFRPTLFGLSLLLFFTTGCVNKLRMTEPARSLGEQLLLSTSIDRSLSELDTEAIGRLKGFKVFISSEYLKTLDQEYLLGSLRDLFLSNGVLVVDKAEEAQMIVEVRSGANSLDSSTATLGIAEDHDPRRCRAWQCCCPANWHRCVPRRSSVPLRPCPPRARRWTKTSPAMTQADTPDRGSLDTRSR